MKERANYNSIDAFKFFLAICVVAIHIKPLYNLQNRTVRSLYEAVVTIAVPFFFISSGFLLADKFIEPTYSDENIDITKRYLFRIVKLYLIWTVIYLPITVYGYYLSGEGIAYNALRFIRGMFLLGDYYNSYMLWYLLSTIYALVLIMLLMHLQFSPLIISAIGVSGIFFGYTVSILIQSRYRLPSVAEDLLRIIELAFGDSGRIFTGMGYISLGMLMNKHSLSIKSSISLFACGFIGKASLDGFLAEISITICSIGFFGLVLLIRLKNGPMYKKMRIMSTLIYFLHLYVWTTFYILVFHEKTYGMISFIGTLIITLLLSVIMCIGVCRKSRLLSIIV